MAGKTLIGTGVTSSPTFANIGTNSGLTDHGVLLSQGTDPFVAVSPGSTGYVLTANGLGADPTFQPVSASGAVITLTGNTGGALTPTAGNFNILGTGSTTVAGSGSTLTAQLTGLTNHSVLVGAGTATITKVGPTATAGQVLQSAGSSADPAFSTATYPATTTINQLLYSSSANVVSGLATANSAILNTSSGGVPSLATSPSVSGTITAGTGLTATTGAITATAGNVVITAGNLTIPATTSGAANGSIAQAGTVFMHSFGTNSTFLGFAAGKTTNTGSYNTGIGYQALTNVTSGQENTGIGRLACRDVTTTSNNTAVGNAAFYTGTGSRNTMIGSNAGSAFNILSGADNHFVGYNAVTSLTTGSFNCGMGSNIVSNLITGSYNVALGNATGSAYNGAESSNILISNAGTNGESNTMRLGTAGTGNGQVSTCYIAGISGVTVTGTAVLCSTAGQLGTIASSERYKENIVEIPLDISVMNLRPVRFNYKADKSMRTQYGLIAEDVDQDFPYLCHYNEDGQPESVKYHELCTFLLHELQKMNSRVEQLEKRVR